MYQHDPRHVSWIKFNTPKSGRKLQDVCSSVKIERDITFRVNEFCQRMSNHMQQSLAKMKWLVSYLKRERQWEQQFEYGGMVEEVATFSDSDWAGYKETRKSSSAGVILLAVPTLKAHTRKQHIVARSSAEGELYAVALEASESKGIVSLLKDLGYEMKPLLAIDAKATKHILLTRGIGILKHIDVAYLWTQDEVRTKRLRVRRAKSE